MGQILDQGMRSRSAGGRHLIQGGENVVSCSSACQRFSRSLNLNQKEEMSTLTTYLNAFFGEGCM